MYIINYITLLDSDEEKLFEGTLSSNDSFLKTFQELDIDIPFSCNMGCCMSCGVRVLEGIEYINQEKYGEIYIEVENDIILMCIAGLETNISTNIRITLKSLM
ncbi:MAG: 2Fe-2S iron-sulfur cluster binding domain-containing protein [Sulfurovum sp.]|nr:2Fe-2S iron-sulfur cluster binding domain-containing protein [Sulfurovum sp.]